MKAEYFIKLVIIITFLFSMQTEAKTSNIYIYNNAESLREYCLKTFNNSDLWYSIIRHNGYSENGEIQKGTSIKIPVKTIKDNLKMENKIQSELSNVIKSGAEIFAKEQMNKLRKLLLQAEEYFKDGRFVKAKSTNEQILKDLSNIEDICNKASNHKVEAKIYDMHGEVDKQPIGKFSWFELKKNDILKEEDKVRTMEKSYADIIFKDESHVFLDETSMILIKKMRENRLNKQNSSRMVLVKGDLQALLNSSKSKNFNIDIPEIKTSINSSYFWLQRNKNKDVNISNYDGTIQVASAGKVVQINKNEGVKVKYKKPPSTPIELLPPPKHLSTEKKGNEYILSWDKVNSAEKYQIQICANKSFLTDIVLLKKLPSNSLTIDDLKDGIYYWKVRSFDKIGLPGKYSDDCQLVFRNKTTKPFLLVKHQIVKDSINIEIETQKGNTLYINKYETEADKQITNVIRTLNKGKNTFDIKTVNKNGNISQTTFSVIYYPQSDIRFSYPKETDTKLVEISGSFDTDYTIILDGKKYKSKNKQFKKIIKLQKGLNLFPVKLRDEETNRIIYSDTLRIILK